MSAPSVLVNKWASVVSSSNGGLVTIFTHGTALKNPDGTSGYGGVLDRILTYNPDTISHTITCYRVPSSSSATNAYVIDNISVPPAATYIIEGPFYSKDSDFYQAKLAEAASSSAVTFVTFQAWYHEMS